MDQVARAYDRLVISYAFGDLPEDQVTELESDPHKLQAEMTRLYMDFVDQRIMWDEKLRLGDVSVDEYRSWTRRSGSIRTKLQGKSAHVKLLVKKANMEHSARMRDDRSRFLRRAIVAHQHAIESHDVEPEEWDLALWDACKDAFDE